MRERVEPKGYDGKYDQERIQNLYFNQGLSLDEIADKLGGVKPTVYRHLFYWRDVKSPWREKAALLYLYDSEELTAGEVAEELGCSRSAVLEWLKKHGIERRHGAQPGEKHPQYGEGEGDTYYGPTWREQRTRARERDGDTCQNCGLGDKEHIEQYDQELHVHHIERFKSFDEPAEAHRLDNLVTLCRVCHDRAECGLLGPQYIAD